MVSTCKIHHHEHISKTITIPYQYNTRCQWPVTVPLLLNVLPISLLLWNQMFPTWTDLHMIDRYSYILAVGIAILRVRMLALTILPNVYVLDSMLSSGLELFQVSLGMELCDETLPCAFTFDLGHPTSPHGTWMGLT